MDCFPEFLNPESDVATIKRTEQVSRLGPGCPSSCYVYAEKRDPWLPLRKGESRVVGSCLQLLLPFNCKVQEEGVLLTICVLGQGLPDASSMAWLDSNVLVLLDVFFDYPSRPKHRNQEP
ncbi:unnamed protein product, partial [Polarella glacialis]